MVKIIKAGSGCKRLGRGEDGAYCCIGPDSGRFCEFLIIFYVFLCVRASTHMFRDACMRVRDNTWELRSSDSVAGMFTHRAILMTPGSILKKKRGLYVGG